MWENRLFLGRDAYTFSITFPLADCPENLPIFGHLDRKDVEKKSSALECVIQDRGNSFSGSLLVTSVSEKEVQCQFSEGRCESVTTNPLDETYVSDLDLGQPSVVSASAISPREAWDPSRGEVALPWVNNGYPDSPNNWVVASGNDYSWNAEVTELSWQPYLIVIVKRILAAVGYDCDLSEWEKSTLRFLLVCNTLPAAWNRPAYALALPRWSVTEFFEKLELFLFAQFDFDHKAKTVTFAFQEDVLGSVAPVELKSVVDSYSVSVAADGDANCEYLGVKRIAYKDNGNPLWPFLSCDWFFDGSRKVPIVEYDTIYDLIERNKRRDSYDVDGYLVVSYGECVFVGNDEPPRPGLPHGYDYSLGRLLYAKDIDTYFVHRAVGTVESKRQVLPGSDFSHATIPVYYNTYVLQPVNVFGSGLPESDDVDSEELDFVPAWTQDTRISDGDDMGEMLFLAPGDYNEPNSASTSDEVVQPGVAHLLQLGEKDAGTGEYYNVVYLGYWDGSNRSGGLSPCPQTDRHTVTASWNYVAGADFSMRLFGKSWSDVARDGLHRVDPSVKFKFSWLADEIPNPRAVFYISGKRYICEKITATFTEHGMSQLLKGEFFPLLDD